ncbi:MAG TPA: TlpA disulfide reductase family protein [Actinomycetota bacterium]|nr:TlpA disulfide reductase family protein [Actinomycetota bacterium]
MTLRRSLVAVLCSALLLLSACGSSGGPVTATGRLPSNPYALPEFDKAAYDKMLARQRGTPVLVNIWASWCGPCRQEAPLLSAASRTYGDRVQFVGVDILDARDSARAFMHESGWTYPSVFDPSGAIRNGLGVLGQPATLFYDADGKLVSTWLGPLTEEVLARRIDAILPT